MKRQYSKVWTVCKEAKGDHGEWEAFAPVWKVKGSGESLQPQWGASGGRDRSGYRSYRTWSKGGSPSFHISWIQGFSLLVILCRFPPLPSTFWDQYESCLRAQALELASPVWDMCLSLTVGLWARNWMFPNVSRDRQETSITVITVVVKLVLGSSFSPKFSVLSLNPF